MIIEGYNALKATHCYGQYYVIKYKDPETGFIQQHSVLVKELDYLKIFSIKLKPDTKKIYVTLKSDKNKMIVCNYTDDFNLFLSINRYKFNLENQFAVIKDIYKYTNSKKGKNIVDLCDALEYNSLSMHIKGKYYSDLGTRLDNNFCKKLTTFLLKHDYLVYDGKREKNIFKGRSPFYRKYT